jgi:hypothetical protein
MSSISELSKKYLEESIKGMGGVLDELKARSFYDRERIYQKYTATFGRLHEIVGSEELPENVQDFLSRLPVEKCEEAIQKLNEATDNFMRDFLKENSL